MGGCICFFFLDITAAVWKLVVHLFGLRWGHRLPQYELFITRWIFLRNYKEGQGDFRHLFSLPSSSSLNLSALQPFLMLGDTEILTVLREVRFPHIYPPPLPSSLAPSTIAWVSRSQLARLRSKVRHVTPFRFFPPPSLRTTRYVTLYLTSNPPFHPPLKQSQEHRVSYYSPESKHPDTHTGLIQTLDPGTLCSFVLSTSFPL